MKLIKGEFKEKLDLLFAPSIKAGFPSPAEDYLSESLDFNRDLIKQGCEMLGMEVKDVAAIVIEGMKPYAAEIGLLGTEAEQA